VSTAIRGIIFTSSNPFRILLYSSFVIAIFSIFYFLNLLINFFLEGTIANPGITTIISILLIFVFLNLFTLGFMGEYIIYIFNHLAKKRSVIFREKINFDN
jgi:hypothetical protein